MKKISGFREKLLLLVELIAVTFVMPTRLAAAQMFMPVFTTLHSFDGSGDAAPPRASALILSSNTLYGITVNGGISNNGTVFAISTNGTAFRTLHQFTGGSDGGHPYGGLVLSGHMLYGTASSGGTGGRGTVFAVDTNGNGFTVLHTFTRISGVDGPNWLSYSNSDGASPFASLVLSGSILYGTAVRGGTLGQGTLFAVNTNGTSFTNLHSFTDGSSPTGLLLSSNILYGTVQGTTAFGDNGSVFAMNTNGTGFKTLHSFTGLSDGQWPNDGLVLLSNNLHGTTMLGGISGSGTVFKVSIEGTGFTILHAFSSRTEGTNADGASPFGGLLVSSNMLYGTALQGGLYGSGALFDLKTDGTGFSSLYSFSALQGFNLTNSDGAGPRGLVFSGSTLYGTAGQGGTSNNGTVFSLAFLPLTAPVIVMQPMSRTNVAGTTASFSVAAKADGSFSYQWLKGSGPMSKQTGSILTLTNVADTDAASYSVIVSNVAGSVTSTPAILTVIDPPRITSQPSSITNLAGSTASFGVVAAGTPPLGYQWLKGTGPMSQQKSAKLTLVNISDADAAQYRVVVTNAAGSVTSDAAALTVINRPLLTVVSSRTTATLTWPNGAVRFKLQVTTNLVAPTVWIPVLSSPVMINGQNVLTNRISDSQQFYRLSE